MTRHELVDQLFAVIERRDLEFIEGWFERHAHPDVEFTSALTSGVEGRVYHGRRGLVDWMADVIDAVKITYGEREYREVGEDVVLVLVRPALEGRGSGVELQIEVGFVLVFEDGLARRGASYASHAEALAAAEQAAARAGGRSHA